MLQVAEFNAIEHIEAIRLRWTSLFYETPSASFFQTLDWLQVYWQHFRGRQQLRVLLVHHRGTVLGILPLVVRQEMTAAGPANVLTYPTINPSQLFGPIGPNPTAILMASLRHLSSQSRDWDSLALTCVGQHNPGRTENAMTLAGFDIFQDVCATVARVRCDVTWPDCISEHGAGVVERVRELEHESTRAGDLTFERLRPLGNSYGNNESLERVLEECVALDQHASFAFKSQPDASAAFFCDAITTASRLGMLDLNLLRLDGRLVAFSFNVHFDDVIQQTYVGETASSLGFHAASVLTLRMLQDSCSRADRCLAFCEPSDFADHMATERLPIVRLQHRTAMPFQTRMAQFGQWLTCLRTKV